jgi:hypothetical protein
MLTPKRVIQICQVLIAVHLLLRAIVFGSAFFYGDDYLFQGRAARLGLLSESYLLYPHDGHLMPAGMLVSGVLERIAPLNYWPVLITLLLLQWLATWLSYRLLRALIGPRPALLIPVLILTLTPMTLLPGAWFAAAINFLPMQIATAIAGLCVLRAVRGGSQWWYVLATLSVIVGLTFFEKAVLIPLTLLAVIVASGPRGGGALRSLGAALRRSWLLWVLLALTVAGYLLFYFEQSGGPDSTFVDSAGIVIMLTDTVIKGLLPALLGGPINWLAIGAGSAAVDPATWVTVIGVVSISAIAVYGCLQSARSRAVWLVAGTYVFVDLILMALGRGSFDIITGLGLSFRYTVDSLLVLLVAIAITFAPPKGHEDGIVARQTRRRARSLITRSRAVAIAIPLVLLAFVSAAIASNFNLISPLSQNLSRDWLTNIQRSVEGRTVPVEILDTPVPDFVLTDLTAPYNLSSWALAPLSNDVRVTDVIHEGVMFNGDGVLVSADVVGVDSFPGPNGDCGWSVTTEPVAITLGAEPSYWYYTLRISYLAPSNVTVAVQYGDGPSIDVELREGAGVLYASIEGGGSRVTITPTQSTFAVCIAQVRVGDLVPTP